jgi:ribosomal protein L13E
VAKFISKSGKEYPLDKSKNGFTAEKPKGLIKKCIHTFKCMFNKDCEKIAKSELAEMSKAELELMGRNNGIELDKRKTKKALVDELYEAL